MIAALTSLALLMPVAMPLQEGQVPTIQEDENNFIITVSESDQDRPTLEDFVNICQEATGRNFTYNDQTQSELKTKKLFMYGQKRIPKQDFYRFFQIMMFINDFVCVDVGPPHIAVTLIQSLTGAAATSGRGIRQKAEYVLPEDLEDYADQPATLVTTVLHLPNTEVRQLTTSLRTLFTDTNTQGMIAASDHSVILQGFGSNIAALAKLLRLIDEEAGRIDSVDPVFDVIPLEFASAEDVADLIDQLLEAQNSARSRPGGNEGARGVSSALQQGDAEAKILVDLRTNSLLVMALPEDMPRIKDLVAALDVEVIEPERNYHVYNLENVAAEELAETLDEFLQDAGRVAAPTGGTGGARPGGGGGTTASSSQNEVVVVPDENSNSLLIAAGKTRYEEVLDLVTQLDQRQHQVLIETALISLTGTDFRDIGVELAAADVMGDGGFGVTNFGLSSITDSDGDGVPDLRVPGDANGTLASGVTAGFLDGDNVNLPILLAAIEQVDESNVLNVPSVLVNNNRTATVSTRDEQPTANTQAGNVTTQTGFGGYEEAGITLTITPSISAANYLRLDIELVVSTFNGSFQDGLPAPRVTRELITTINVPDGDTMVIGGIVTDNAAHTRRGVPWLSQVPLLGAAFRRDSDTKSRTTLYFFVTPHILQDESFADLAEISYRQKLEAAEVIGSDRLRVIDPDFEVGAKEVDFVEQFGVPLYRSPAGGEVAPEAVGIDPIRRDELLREALEPEGAQPAEEPVLQDAIIEDGR
ncbi:MAG: secretin N-terminal domain-containing protein [Planctomycetota bacterium]